MTSPPLATFVLFPATVTESTLSLLTAQARPELFGRESKWLREVAPAHGAVQTARAITMPDSDKIGDRGRDERLGSHALVGATTSYAVLVFASLLVLGTPPAAAESGPQVVAWFRENRDAVRWAVWMLTVSIPPLAVMIALLRRLLPSPHRDVFLIGGVTFLTMGGVFSWTLAALALHADSLEPAIARTVLDVAVFFGPVLTGATTTMMAPVTLLALRGRAHLPVWLGLLGLTAFVEQSIETITIFGSTGFTQPGGAMNLQLGAGLTLAWLLSFGLWGGLRGHAQDLPG